jgi:hypothetical protein
MKADADGPLMLNVEVGVDSAGNYTNEILVEGRRSGERLLVTVEVIADEATV